MTLHDPIFRTTYKRKEKTSGRHNAVYDSLFICDDIIYILDMFLVRTITVVLIFLQANKKVYIYLKVDLFNKEKIR